MQQLHVEFEPWAGAGVFEQIQEEVRKTPELQHGSLLILDESADEKAGGQSVGASREYNGRMGKVDECQVAVVLGYANLKVQPWPLWALVDAEIFLPEDWFGDAYAQLRKKVGVPEERKAFETKPDLGLKMIRRAKAEGMPFEAVLCDDLYGRSHKFRAELDGDGVLYLADVPSNLRVYLEEPIIGIPEPKPGKKGPKPQQAQVLNGIRSYRVQQVGQLAETRWQSLRIRTNERGVLEDQFAARLVWTWDKEQNEARQEWLVMRIERNGDHTYAFGNAPHDVPLQFLAEWLCGRYFVERVIQDAKEEQGWDEFQAQKYLAWEHHTALTACVPCGLSLPPSSPGPKNVSATLNWYSNLKSKSCQPCPLPMSEICCVLSCLSRSSRPKKPNLKLSNILSIVPVLPPAACAIAVRRWFN